MYIHELILVHYYRLFAINILMNLIITINIMTDFYMIFVVDTPNCYQLLLDLTYTSIVCEYIIIIIITRTYIPAILYYRDINIYKHNIDYYNTLV